MLSTPNWEKNIIENIKPGKLLDLSVVRKINKLETEKNCLVVLALRLY